MAITIHVNGTSNSLVHKGSNGIAKNTLPDVCKTPSPAGPVPIPYPVIISLSSDLAKGTKTVKVDGGNMAAIKGSEFSRCTGDEPGTAGGIVSSTFIKEATWILYSFDVKMEGKNACRLSDKMLMNHGNTVCLAGELQVIVLKETGSDTCPTCKKARGEQQTEQTKSYEEFFSQAERDEFDRIAKENPDLAPMLPPKNGRYKVNSKPQNDAARDRINTAKKKARKEGRLPKDKETELHHPHPIKVAGCDVHQECLIKPDQGTPERDRVDKVDGQINDQVKTAIARNS